MTLKFGMVMDSIDLINIKKDTSFAMCLEAQSRGWTLHYMELNDLFLRNGRAYARTRTLQVERNADRYYQFLSEQTIALEDLNVIMMRKDPPFNQEFLYATHILEQAERHGTYVINKPQSLRDANEKLFTAWFPQCCADTLVAREPHLIRDFLTEYGDIILKPLDGMGGTSIFRLRLDDPNISVILETMTEYSSRYVMAQKYLPEIKYGDKRILMVNGEPIPYALARIPAQGETRGNIAAGGTGVGQPLTGRDVWIAKQVGETLKEKGLIFVGLDVIGDYLTEINVTSPTCVQELDKQFGLNICAQLMDHIVETKLTMVAQFVSPMSYKDMPKSADTLSFWLFVAAVIHAVVLMGVAFVPPKPHVIGKAIEVTIVNSSTKRAPENAKYFAQNNQIAAGLENQKPIPIAKKEPNPGQDSKKQQESKATKSQALVQHRLITQKTADKKLASAENPEKTETDDQNSKSQPELSVEELDKQIALLELKLKQQKESSEKTNIKSVSMISAHKYIAAQYVKDWERKVERIGNLNYPQINGKQDFSGTLSMDVGVNADGSIYDMKIVKSSGILELDEAAKRIVNMSAPFAPLPQQITQELDVLRIRRVWSFSEEGNTVTSSNIID